MRTIKTYKRKNDSKIMLYVNDYEGRKKTSLGIGEILSDEKLDKYQRRLYHHFHYAIGIAAPAIEDFKEKETHSGDSNVIDTGILKVYVTEDGIVAGNEVKEKGAYVERHGKLYFLEDIEKKLDLIVNSIF